MATNPLGLDTSLHLEIAKSAPHTKISSHFSSALLHHQEPNI
jgi:hypothetical protein